MISFKKASIFPIKKDCYFESKAINFLTWGIGKLPNNDNEKYSSLHLSHSHGLTSNISGEPETINKVIFNGLLYKFTCHRADKADGSMKKFSAWVNPENISFINPGMINDTEIRFFDSQLLLICEIPKAIVSKLIDHKKKYLERMKGLYGKEAA